jgi:hypothetical protein
MNHSSHTAAAAAYIITNSAVQQLTEASAMIDGLFEGPIYGDAVSAAAVQSSKSFCKSASRALRDGRHHGALRR